MPSQYFLGGFIEQVRQHYGVTVEEFELELPGGPAVVRALVRETPTGTWFAPLQELKDSTRLTVDAVRSLCVQLGIPSLEFGVPPQDDGRMRMSRPP